MNEEIPLDEFVEGIVGIVEDAVMMSFIMGGKKVITIIIVVESILGVTMTKRNVYFWKFHGYYIFQPSEHIPIEEVIE